MDCYNYYCPFRYSVFPTSETRCDCTACSNRSNSTGYIVSNRTLAKEESEMIEKEKMQEDLDYGKGTWC